MSAIRWEPGLKLHGFAVTAHTPLPELNAELIELRHEVTGARMVHLAAEDDNNLFAVGFHTTPHDSTGVAHILEHTVLCGSEHFPVRDPFFSMLKRSLNTFMNAFTASDWTLYPFSSQNRKDFFNLMDIYLDAAFFPRLLERDFHQEGHRLELADPADPDSAVVFKGVVYNEMKGAMADPSSLLARRLNRALYPTTTYGHNSGGEPAAIPDLSWEQLRAFHATYYHPANAYFCTYGNLPLEEHLRVVEEKALSRFGPKAVDSAVPDEVRFESPKRLIETFPLASEESQERRSMVQVAWLTCPISDSFERTALSLLSNLLLGNPAAPLHKALLDSKLGQNLAPGTGYHDDNRETFFAAGLQGTEPEEAEKIEKIVIDTLEKAAQEGFPAERIEAALHQMEFAHREVTGDQYPYALVLLMRLLGPWIHAGDPVTPLLLDQDLERVRKEAAQGPFFQELIRRHLLGNSHRVTLTLRPDPGQAEREEAETAARLETLGAALCAEDRQRIRAEAEELQRSQEAEEDLSVLPTLEFSDIPEEERPVRALAGKESGTPVHWFDQPTNGIVYFTSHLSTRDLPEDLRPYAPLFCATLTQVGAAGHDYMEMAERMTAATGGIRAGTSVLESPGGLDDFAPLLEVKGKALRRNGEKLFDILEDIFTAPDFSDLERLHTVFNQIKTNLENSIPGAGHRYAARAAAASLSAGASQREEWSGVSLVRLAKQVAALAPGELAEVAGKLRAIGERLLDGGLIRCALTAEARAFDSVRPSLGAFLKALPRGAKEAAAAAGPFAPRPLRTGWAASLPVNYVTRVFRAVPLVHPDSPALMVLSRLLRAGYLHREIREKGGAYGGLASFDPETGLFSMLSYRDPHLIRTLQVYRDAAEWAASGDFTDEAVKEAVLSVFSEIDRPLSPGGRGNREFAHIRQGLSLEMRQSLRGKILAVDAGSLRRAAERHLLAQWPQSAVGVMAGEEALRRANEELGDEGLRIERI
ncbi:insulinase family protein [uncultured Desulfuromonas sp.]|uniref:insulinase family protein n=1 Tax=uncultured Desulfuromonas sp. TaxID=181013 RepID=UPI00260844D6|nr:insulinase family protein [uncultured Desulfuromonas sp.]